MTTSTTPQHTAGPPENSTTSGDINLELPDSSGANAGRPQLDEDYLILSTIHSAKGQEWHTVYVLNLVDGCIPSDMATGTPEQIEEERRLLYVAMTRAKDHLYLIQPLRFFRTQQHRFGNGHIIAPRSRFLLDDMMTLFTRTVASSATRGSDDPGLQAPVNIDIGEQLRGMWS